MISWPVPGITPWKIVGVSDFVPVDGQRPRLDTMTSSCFAWAFVLMALNRATSRSGGSRGNWLAQANYSLVEMRTKLGICSNSLARFSRGTAGIFTGKFTGRLR